MAKEKPSVTDILDLVRRGETVYSTLYSAFEQDQRFYELEFFEQLGLPKQFAKDGIVLSTARDMVDAYVDHLDISNARVYLNKKGISPKPDDERETLRKLYLGILHVTNIERPWARHAAKHLGTHGLSVIRTLWASDLWPDKPEKGDSSDSEFANRIETWKLDTQQYFPIAIDAINPRNIILDPGFGGRQFVIEHHDQLILDIWKKWPNWDKDHKRDADQRVRYIAYWDDTWRSVIIDDEPVLKDDVMRHTYGFIPYVPIDAGLGNLSWDSLPEMRYVGILRYIFKMLLSESRNYSMADILLKKEVMKGGWLSGRNAKAISSINQEYGKYNPMPDGVEVHEWESKMPPGALGEHLLRTQDMINSHAAPRSTRGLSESGVRSGADRRLIIAEGSTKFQYSNMAFRHGVSRVLANCAMLVKNVIPGDVQIWARTQFDGEIDELIEKDKINPPFACYVEFAPFSEEDEFRKQDALIRQRTAGLISQETAWNQMSHINPVVEKERLAEERIRNTEAYQAALENGVAVRTGVLSLQQQQEAQRLQEQGNMTTSPPNRAEPGSAEERENQRRAVVGPDPNRDGQGRGGGGSSG